MSKIFLLRHLKSQWNEDDRFAGWVDNPLSKNAILDAKPIAEKLSNEKIDVTYTSPLMRNMETVARIFDNFKEKYPLFIHLDRGKMSRPRSGRGSLIAPISSRVLDFIGTMLSGQKWGHFTDISENDIPVYVSENLNERYYGALQGLNKKEIEEKYGQDLAHAWRRGFADRPPHGESLKDVYKRAVLFFKKYVEKDLKNGKNVLLVASHNSLRAIVKYIENISDENIKNLELPFGALMSYEFDGKGYMKYN